jgi:hypothetical protein
VSTPPVEPPPGEGPPRADVGAEERRCPRCTAPYEPLQEYCLECGQRLVPLPSDSYTRTVVWSRESPVWLWIALVALLLVALAAGAIVALAATDDDEPTSAASSSEDTIPVLPPTTGPITVEPPTIDSTITIPTFPTGTTTTVFPTQPTTTFPTSSTTSTTTTGGSGTIISWPSNKDGFTVVLKSTPVSEGRGPAESAAQQAINRGLPEVGILNSSNYSTLNPGFYVTFTGVYDTENEAENALPRARSSGFPTAYVREVAD